MTNIDILDSSVSKLITLRKESSVNYQLTIVKDQLKQLFLEDVVPEKFATILNLTVIDPIRSRINYLNDNLPMSDRETIGERITIVSVVKLLEVFLNEVYFNYSPMIKDSQYFFENQEKALIEHEARRDSILQPQYDEVHAVTDLEPKHCKEILNRGFDKALAYFSRSGANNGLRQEAITFVTRGQLALTEMKVYLSKLKQDLEILKATKKSYSGIFTDDEDSIDLDNYYNSKAVYMLYRIENVTLYISILNKLTNTLVEMYSIRNAKAIEIDKQTVFGDRNFKIVDKLFEVLQPFLHPSTKLEDFTYAFTLQDDYSTDKISFYNVNLNNYAGLISVMQPYFEVVTRGKLKYNQWWAERFTFNGEDKTKTDVSNMRSATKSPDRKPDHPSVIREVVEILKEI